MEYDCERESLVNLARTATALAVNSSPQQLSSYNKEEAVHQSLWLHNLDLSVKPVPKLLPCRHMYVLKFFHLKIQSENMKILPHGICNTAPFLFNS